MQAEARQQIQQRQASTAKERNKDKNSSVDSSSSSDDIDNDNNSDDNSDDNDSENNNKVAAASTPDAVRRGEKEVNCMMMMTVMA